MKLGWIGLGAIGGPLAMHVVHAGHDLVVFNRSPQKAAELVVAGAKLAPSISSLAAECNIVFSALPNVEQSERVCNEVFSGLKCPDIYVELSTLSPSSVRALAEIAISREAAFVDAPVSGTADQRAAADMTLLCGADEATFDKIRPIMASFASSISLLGPVGSGSIAKVCNQLVVMTGLITAVEALELGLRHGLAVEPLHAAIMQSSGSARSLSLIAREYAHRNYRTIETPRAALRLAVKDLEEAVAMAREVGLHVELAEAALSIWRRAECAGLGEADMYNIIDQIVPPNS